MTADLTAALRLLMENAGLPTFKALSQAAGISEKQLRTLRRGSLETVPLGTAIAVSRALGLSLPQLIAALDPTQPTPAVPASPDLTTLQQEYDRLRASLTQQKDELWQTFQQDSVHILESLLLQLPTAAYAAQQNPQAPAVKLLPLLRPIDQLLQHWGITAIATVGTESPYDPQHHQLMDGTASPGDRVRVRYVGYRQGDRILYRAKVSPVP